MAKKFEITILGVNSAFPVHGRHPSCQIVNYDERLFMIDCGEAAQIQVSKYKIKRNKLDHIFISHLHGDHCYGLPGLLTSFSLGGRTRELYLHGPHGIKKFIDTIIEVTGSYLSYDLIIKEYDTSECHSIQIHDHLKVLTFPMKHGMPTMGFRFEECNLEKNLDASKIKELNLTIDEIKRAKKGEDILRSDEVISCDQVTFPSHTPRTYSYCSDTVYDLDLVQYISDSSLLYHETTYLDEYAEVAKERMHTTLGQAIDIAKRSHIDRLIVGHYSSRYQDPTVFLDAGIDRYSGLLLGEEGRTYTV